MNSSTRAWAFIAFFSLGLIICGQMIAGREGLLWGLVLSLSINSVVYFYATKRILALFSSQKLEGRDPWGVLELTQKIAKKAKLPTPSVIIIKSSSPQSLALGHSWGDGKILLTDGLLDALSKSELETVIAYNIASIKKLDTLATLVTSSLCGAILSVSMFLDSLLRWLIGAKADNFSPQSHFFTYLVSPFCYTILKFTHNDANYYNTDKLAMTYVKDPKQYATALWKLQSYGQTKPLATSPAIAHMFIVNPLTNKGWSRYFLAQPAVNKRIKKLISYYPI